MSLSGDQLRERRYPRYPVSVPTVGHARQIDGPIQGWVRNLSDGGLMAEFPVTLLAGSRRHEQGVVETAGARRDVALGAGSARRGWRGNRKLTIALEGNAVWNLIRRIL